jgi:hypothetical protein
MSVTYVMPNGSGLKIPTKVGGSLSFDEVCEIVSKVVFRNANFTVYPASYFTDCDPKLFHGSIGITIPVVKRDYDRRFPHQRYMPVCEAQEKDEEDAQFRYDSIGYGDKRVDDLQGTYQIPIGVDEGQLRYLVLVAVAKAMCHEIQENFYIDGERVFDPHGECGEVLLPSELRVDV